MNHFVRLKAAASRHPLRATLITVVAMATIVPTAVVGFRVADPPEGRIPPGVAIAGIDVGGLAFDEAERTLRARLAPPTGNLTLVEAGGGATVSSTPIARLDPIPRIRRAVRRANRPVSVWYRIRHELTRGTRREVEMSYRLRARAVEKIVRRTSRALDRPARSARVRVAAGGIVVAPAADGRAVERNALRRRLVQLPRRVVVPIASIPPPVSDAEAQAARQVAARIIRTPVTVRGAGQMVILNRSVLREALLFRPTEAGIDVRIDPAVIERAVTPTFAAQVRPAKPAGFRVRGSKVEVIASAPGRAVDGAALARAIERRQSDLIALRTTSVAPSLTTGQAQRLGIRELVSEFITPYACCQPRVTNIMRAALILDGQIIRPGENFSLNETMGERTLARGFVPAPQINAGRLEDAVGGGVSQIATTVFNAAFFAGLKIITHTPHEFWISRYPPGREATVSWGGPELIVKNDWPAGIMMKVRASKSALRVQMFSTGLGRRVTTQTQANAIEGAAFSTVYTRRVFRGGGARPEERYTWTYRAPPPG